MMDEGVYTSQSCHYGYLAYIIKAGGGGGLRGPGSFRCHLRDVNLQ